MHLTRAAEYAALEPDLLEALGFLKDLHRHKRAYATFGTYGEGKLHQYSVTSTHFEVFALEHAELLRRDAAVSINACAAPRNVETVPGQKKKHLRFAAPIIKSVRYKGRSIHSSQNMRSLTACYVDLDCHKLDSPTRPEAALEEVLRMAARGEIPYPSLAVFSGRGVWILWYLHDAKDHKRSHFGGQRDELQRLQRVNRYLATRLRHLGADQSCTDAARFLPLHGTFRTRAGTKVRWQHLNGCPTYGLHDLCAQLHLTVPHVRKAPQDTDKSNWGGGPVHTRDGWRQSASNRLQVFEVLCELRGGFNEGTRNKAVYLYARALIGANQELRNACRSVSQFGKEMCHPYLPEPDCARITRSASLSKHRYTKYQTIADMLDVTEREAAEIRARLKNDFPAATGRSDATLRLSKRERMELRRDLIQNLFAIHGPMTVGEWRVLLAGCGHQLSRGAVHTSLKDASIPPKPRKHQ